MHSRRSRTHAFPVLIDSYQARNHGGAEGQIPPTKFFAHPLEKCVGHSLKLSVIVKKIWTPLRKLFAPMVSQAGYGPVAYTTTTAFCLS